MTSLLNFGRRVFPSLVSDSVGFDSVFAVDEEWVGERDRERDIEGGREIERQRERATDRQTETEAETEREVEGEGE